MVDESYTLTMKKILVALLFCMGQAQAQTIGDLFVQLPQTIFEPIEKMVSTPFTTSTRKSIVTAKQHRAVRNFQQDNANGFLAFATETDGDGYAFEMTYWKLASGDKLIATLVNNNGNCSRYTQSAEFWLYQKGKITNVTKEYYVKVALYKFYKKITPNISTLAKQGQIKPLWVLPQKGTTIRIIAPEYDCGDDSLPPGNFYFEMQWQNGKFELVKQNE